MPFGLLIDKAGNLLVADEHNHRIRKITPAGDVSTLTGSIAGYRDGPLDQALFRYPAAICLDSVGNMYVSDYP